MNLLQVRFFGDCAVTAAGERITSLTKPRLQSLLAYLILHRAAPQSRAHLSGVLWPDSSPAQAHTNLRNLLHLLRGALPGGEQAVLADNQTIQWNPDVPLSLDVFDFQRIAAQDSLEKQSLADLEAAVQIYQGDLLPGCYDAWIEGEREHYRQLFIHLLDQMIERYESLRRYPEAIAACQRLAACEPFHRDGYPRLVRLQVLNGAAPAAMKTYRTYARLLKRELDIEPPAELQALYEHARRAARRVGAEVVSTVSPAAGQLPLVGRISEWQAIQRFWKTAPAGQAQMLFISGEAGIGKTRLAEELVAWASRQGIRTAVAHCYASEGALPYAPAAAWLRVLDLPPLEPVWLAELSRLLPELLKNKAKAPPPLSEGWERLRLFEALARAVVGGRQKTLLLIEDLHWCDHDTVEWLHYLLRYNLQAPLLVIGTARSEETDANTALGKLLADLRQAGGLSRDSSRTTGNGYLEIELGRLNEEETGQLATHTAGKALEHGLGALIYRETEGNPLFIVETVRAELFRHGRLPGVQPLPYRSRAVLEQRIHQLSPGARDLCLLAATIGRSFTMEVLHRACRLAEPDLVHGLEELAQRRIVREIDQKTFDFSHDRLREAAFAGISGPHLQMLHRQVADALVSLENPDLESRSGEIARHYEEAGNAGLAIQHYRRAGENARKIFANQRALQYYQRAIGLCEARRAGSAGEDMAEDLPGQLYEDLGDMLTLVGDFSRAQQAFEHVLTLIDLSQGQCRSQQGQLGTQQGLWRAQINRKISAVLILAYQRPQALAALDQAEEALGLPPGGGSKLERQEWIQIQLARSDVMYWNNRPEEMDAIHRQIQPLVESDGRPDQQVELLGQQLMARFRHERYRLSNETIDIARHRLALVSTLDNPYDTAWAQFHMGFSLLWHGDPLEARTWLSQSHEAALRMGARLLEVRSLAYLSVSSRRLEDTVMLREETERLEELAIGIGEFVYQGYSQANQGWLAWQGGDHALAEQLCKSAKEIWREKGGGIFHWLADWVLLAAAVSRRDLALAEQRTLALLEPDPTAQPILEPVAKMLEEALRVYRLGQAEEAVRRFNQVLEMVKNTGDL